MTDEQLLEKATEALQRLSNAFVAVVEAEDADPNWYEEYENTKILLIMLRKRLSNMPAKGYQRL